jgi:DNA-binding CsgD family transcriptional regulator
MSISKALKMSDRSDLGLLQQSLIQVEDQPFPLSKEQQIVIQLRQVFERLGLLLVSLNGQIQFITYQAKKLLQQYALTHNNKALPEPLHYWFKTQIAQRLANGDFSQPCLPFLIEQTGRQLCIRLMPNAIGDQYVLQLEEREPQTFSIQALELIGLTKREAEVLFWVAKDKSNSAIAKVLGCSEGTVRKHLEHIHSKLGVQTRTAAVMVALEKLGLLRG